MAAAAKEAVAALTALGYTNMEASKAVKKVEITENMSVEDILKASLKHLSFFIVFNRTLYHLRYIWNGEL